MKYEYIKNIIIKVINSEEVKDFKTAGDAIHKRVKEAVKEEDKIYLNFYKDFFGNQKIEKLQDINEEKSYNKGNITLKLISSNETNRRNKIRKNLINVMALTAAESYFSDLAIKQLKITKKPEICSLFALNIQSQQFKEGKDVLLYLNDKKNNEQEKEKVFAQYIQDVAKQLEKECNYKDDADFVEKYKTMRHLADALHFDSRNLNKFYREITGNDLSKEAAEKINKYHNDAQKYYKNIDANITRITNSTYQYFDKNSADIVQKTIDSNKNYDLQDKKPIANNAHPIGKKELPKQNKGNNKINALGKNKHQEINNKNKDNNKINIPVKAKKLHENKNKNDDLENNNIIIDKNNEPNNGVLNAQKQLNENVIKENGVPQNNNNKEKIKKNPFDGEDFVFGHYAERVKIDKNQAKKEKEELFKKTKDLRERLKEICEKTKFESGKPEYLKLLFATDRQIKKNIEQKYDLYKYSKLYNEKFDQKLVTQEGDRLKQLAGGGYETTPTRNCEPYLLCEMSEGDLVKELNTHAKRKHFAFKTLDKFVNNNYVDAIDHVLNAKPDFYKYFDKNAFKHEVGFTPEQTEQFATNKEDMTDYDINNFHEHFGKNVVLYGGPYGIGKNIINTNATELTFLFSDVIPKLNDKELKGLSDEIFVVLGEFAKERNLHKAFVGLSAMKLKIEMQKFKNALVSNGVTNPSQLVSEDKNLSLTKAILNGKKVVKDNANIVKESLDRAIKKYDLAYFQDKEKAGERLTQKEKAEYQKLSFIDETRKEVKYDLAKGYINDFLFNYDKLQKPSKEITEIRNDLMDVLEAETAKRFDSCINKVIGKATTFVEKNKHKFTDENNFVLNLCNLKVYLIQRDDLRKEQEAKDPNNKKIDNLNLNDKEVLDKMINFLDKEAEKDDEINNKSLEEELDDLEKNQKKEDLNNQVNHKNKENANKGDENKNADIEANLNNANIIPDVNVANKDANIPNEVNELNKNDKVDNIVIDEAQENNKLDKNREDNKVVNNNEEAQNNELPKDNKAKEDNKGNVLQGQQLNENQEDNPQHNEENDNVIHEENNAELQKGVPNNNIVKEERKLPREEEIDELVKKTIKLRDFFKEHPVKNSPFNFDIDDQQIRKNVEKKYELYKVGKNYTDTREQKRNKYGEKIRVDGKFQGYKSTHRGAELIAADDNSINNLIQEVNTQNKLNHFNKKLYDDIVHANYIDHINRIKNTDKDFIDYFEKNKLLLEAGHGAASDLNFNFDSNNEYQEKLCKHIEQNKSIYQSVFVSDLSVIPFSGHEIAFLFNEFRPDYSEKDVSNLFGVVFEDENNFNKEERINLQTAFMHFVSISDQYKLEQIRDGLKKYHVTSPIELESENKNESVYEALINDHKLKKINEKDKEIYEAALHVDDALYYEDKAKDFEKADNKKPEEAKKYRDLSKMAKDRELFREWKIGLFDKKPEIVNQSKYIGDLMIDLNNLIKTEDANEKRRLVNKIHDSCELKSEKKLNDKEELIRKYLLIKTNKYFDKNKDIEFKKDIVDEHKEVKNGIENQEPVEQNKNKSLLDLDDLEINDGVEEDKNPFTHLNYSYFNHDNSLNVNDATARYNQGESIGVYNRDTGKAFVITKDNPSPIYFNHSFSVLLREKVINDNRLSPLGTILSDITKDENFTNVTENVEKCKKCLDRYYEMPTITNDNECKKLLDQVKDELDKYEKGYIYSKDYKQGLDKAIEQPVDIKQQLEERQPVFQKIEVKEEVLKGPVNLFEPPKPKENQPKKIVPDKKANKVYESIVKDNLEAAEAYYQDKIYVPQNFFDEKDDMEYGNESLNMIFNDENAFYNSNGPLKRNDAEKIFKNHQMIGVVDENGNKAYYRLGEDKIQMHESFKKTKYGEMYDLLRKGTSKTTRSSAEYANMRSILKDLAQGNIDENTGLRNLRTNINLYKQHHQDKVDKNDTSEKSELRFSLVKQVDKMLKDIERDRRIEKHFDISAKAARIFKEYPEFEYDFEGKQEDAYEPEDAEVYEDKKFDSKAYIDKNKSNLHDYLDNLSKFSADNPDAQELVNDLVDRGYHEYPERQRTEATDKFADAIKKGKSKDLSDDDYRALEADKNENQAEGTENPLKKILLILAAIALMALLVSSGAVGIGTLAVGVGCIVLSKYGDKLLGKIGSLIEGKSENDKQEVEPLINAARKSKKREVEKINKQQALKYLQEHRDEIDKMKRAMKEHNRQRLDVSKDLGISKHNVGVGKVNDIANLKVQEKEDIRK